MSRRTSGRATRTLAQSYRHAALADNWETCLLIAEQMRGLSDAGAETQYARAYALERLGRSAEARRAYESILIMNPSHGKTQRRLVVVRSATDH